MSFEQAISQWLSNVILRTCSDKSKLTYNTVHAITWQSAATTHPWRLLQHHCMLSHGRALPLHIRGVSCNTMHAITGQSSATTPSLQ